MLFDLLRVAASRVGQDMELCASLQVNGRQQQPSAINYNGRNRRVRSQKSKHHQMKDSRHYHRQQQQQQQPQQPQSQPQQQQLHPQLNLNLNFDLNFNLNSATTSAQPQLVPAMTIGAAQNKPLDLSMSAQQSAHEAPPIELLAGNEARLRLDATKLERNFRFVQQQLPPMSSTSPTSSISSAISSCSQSSSSELISSTNPSTRADHDNEADLGESGRRHVRSACRAGQNKQKGAKSHLCNQCGRCFSRSDMLTRHSRLHSGLKPYQCAKCKQVFSRSDHLSTHERTHTGEKPYQCEFCAYSACRRDMITRHMRIHRTKDDRTTSKRSPANQSKGRSSSSKAGPRARSNQRLMIGKIEQ